MTSLTHKQYAVLAAVYAGADLPSEITEVAGLPHCCTCIDTLEERELVVTELHDTHRFVELTSAGLAVAKLVLGIKATAKPAEAEAA